MNFSDLLQNRFSARVYESRPVPDEALKAVLEAARLAPSAANRQPFHLVVVTGGEQRHAINTTYPRDWFRVPPVVIVVCTEPARAWVRGDGKNYADVDGAIAMDHITLRAAELGLGTCWIAAFDTAKVRTCLGIPAGIEPLAMTPLGYSAETPRPKHRKALEDMVHREAW